jgi:hypothetical protein
MKRAIIRRPNSNSINVTILIHLESSIKRPSKRMMGCFLIVTAETSQELKKCCEWPPQTGIQHFK